MKSENKTPQYREFDASIRGWAFLSNSKIVELLPVAEEKARKLTGEELVRANNHLEAMRFCVEAA